MSVPSRQADEALDEQIEMLRHMIRSSRPHSGSEEAHDAWDDAIDKAYAVLDTVRDELERLRRLEDGLREITTWFKREPWKGSPDPGSFGGHGPYSPAERDLGYGTYRDPRFLPALLAGADEPDGGGAKCPNRLCNDGWVPYKPNESGGAPPIACRHEDCPHGGGAK